MPWDSFIITLNVFTVKHLISLLAAFAMIFISCKKDEDLIKITEPGYFVLTELKTLKSSNAENVPESSQSDFNLGELKASMNYFFILTNGGEQPIFNIKLNTDNELFNISPKDILKLEGNTQPGSSSGSGFIPVISLGVVHGMQLNGVGFADLLAKGNNTSTLTITGKTLAGKDTVSIRSSYDFTVDAKVMDIKLYVDNSEFDITKNYGGMSTTLGGLGFMRCYFIDSGNIEIENTGNIDIDLTYGSNKVLLEPNAKKQIDIITDEFTPPMIFRLDGNGTITDNNRIQLGNDGIGYFSINPLPL